MSAPLAPGEETPLALTMGEPAGVGGELTLMAWLRRRQDGLPAFLAIDDPTRLRELARRLKWTVPVHVINDPAEAAEIFPNALPVLAESLPTGVNPGQPDAANAPAVIRSIERAVTLAKSGDVSALVTNPIQKSSLYDAGFGYPGHTEFLAALNYDGSQPVMMLASPALRVVPATIHVPIAEVPAHLSSALLVKQARIITAALKQDFGIAAPRIAVAGLNPHAGERGGIGREETEIIAPAIAEMTRDGIAATGPFAGDSLFHPEARAGYDCVLCMYHDQALIPIKTLDFYGGVNVTLGLGFIRTSPDHGAALALAGRGTARPDSLIAALRIARQMADHRAAAA